MPSLLPKLVIVDLPRLTSQAPSTKDIATFVIAIKRWSRQHGIREYIAGPLPGDPDPEKVAESRRIVMSGIASDNLRGDYDEVADGA